KQSAVDELQTQLTRLRAESAEAHQSLAHLRERSSGASERAAVLTELEQRLDGVSGGVKQLLAAAQGATASPLTEIRGLVADLLQVTFEVAPLVEVALG